MGSAAQAVITQLTEEKKKLLNPHIYSVIMRNVNCSEQSLPQLQQLPSLLTFHLSTMCQLQVARNSKEQRVEVGADTKCVLLPCSLTLL